MGWKKRIGPLAYLADDLQAEFDARGHEFSKLYIVLFHTGFHLVVLVRLQSALRLIPVIGPGLARVVFVFTSIIRGCEVSPAASIGPGFRVGHPLGIVIGSHVRAGRNLTVMHHVTVGGRRNVGSPRPAVQTIGDDVVIGTGAVLLGDIEIGSNVVIGAQALVVESVSDRGVVFGHKGRVIEKKQRSGD